jgi:hypothetical protein
MNWFMLFVILYFLYMSFAKTNNLISGFIFKFVPFVCSLYLGLCFFGVKIYSAYVFIGISLYCFSLLCFVTNKFISKLIFKLIPCVVGVYLLIEALSSLKLM